MGYSPWGCKESDMTEATLHARTTMMGELFVHFSRASGPVEEDGI